MNRQAVIVNEKYCFEEETQLTVHKTSIFFPGDGFAVYDSNGDIVFRFDSYNSDSEPRDELVLMDASGKCLLSLHRKKPSLHQRWEGYLGESKEDHDHVFSIHKSSIIGPSNIIVEVHNDPGDEYQIQGSYLQRSCMIYSTTSTTDYSSKEPVAEIKRKVDPTIDVMLGKDVFWLCLKPGFDGAFAMGLVLVLDQMYGDEDAQDINAIS